MNEDALRAHEKEEAEHDPLLDAVIRRIGQLKSEAELRDEIKRKLGIDNGRREE